MTDQTPEPVDSGDLFEIDESAVEPEKTTNLIDVGDDVEIDPDQTPVGDPGLYVEDEELPDGPLTGQPDGVRLGGFVGDPDGAE